jgi:hypothetical protein
MIVFVLLGGYAVWVFQSESLYYGSWLSFSHSLLKYIFNLTFFFLSSVLLDSDGTTVRSLGVESEGLEAQSLLFPIQETTDQVFSSVFSSFSLTLLTLLFCF